MEIGQRLKKLREKQKVGLRELARNIGYNPSTISRIERGKETPSESFLKKIAEFFNLDVNTLLLEAQMLSTEMLEDFSKDPEYFGKLIPLLQKIAIGTVGYDRKKTNTERAKFILMQFVKLISQLVSNVDLKKHPKGKQELLEKYNAAQKELERLVNSQIGSDFLRAIVEDTPEEDKILADIGEKFKKDYPKQFDDYAVELYPLDKNSIIFKIRKADEPLNFLDSNEIDFYVTEDASKTQNETIQKGKAVIDFSQLELSSIQDFIKVSFKLDTQEGIIEGNL